jgi:DNA-binding transcriptional ArsR family regulator
VAAERPLRCSLILEAKMTVAADQLDATFTALADPTRRAIVARLASGDATVNNLAAPFDMTLPAISKHLKVLERCGLISRTRRAQFRPCHLEMRQLDAAVSWIEEYRRIWTERFDKLDDHLRDIQRGGLGAGLPGAGGQPHE